MEASLPAEASPSKTALWDLSSQYPLVPPPPFCANPCSFSSFGWKHLTATEVSPHMDGSVSIYGRTHLTATEASPHMDGSVSIYGRTRLTATEASPYMDGRVSQPRKRLHIWMAISPSQRRHLAQRYARVKSIQLILVRLHSQGSIPQFLSEASFSAKAYQGQSSQMLYF